MSYGCAVCEYLKEWDTCYGCWLEDRGLYEHEIHVHHRPYWCPLDNRSQEWINKKLKRREEYLNSFKKGAKNGKIRGKKRRKG